MARLLDGRILTGSAKFRRRPADATVLLEHLDALKRLASSGRSWAREALEPGSPVLMVSASGFKDSFHSVAHALGHEMVTWSIEDLF